MLKDRWWKCAFSVLHSLWWIVFCIGGVWLKSSRISRIKVDIIDCRQKAVCMCLAGGVETNFSCHSYCGYCCIVPTRPCVTIENTNTTDYRLQHTPACCRACYFSYVRFIRQKKWLLSIETWKIVTCFDYCSFLYTDGVL